MSGEQLSLMGTTAPKAAEEEAPAQAAASSPAADAAGKSEAEPGKAPKKRRSSRARKAPAKPRSSAPEPSGERPTLYLVDGPNIAFRAHYAPMAALTNSRGEPTKALFGYTNQVLRLIREYQPDYLLLCWDPAGDSTFRNELYADYKGTRPDMPSELRMQMPRFPEVAEALGLRHVVIPGYEADDVMGTLAVRYKDVCDVTIVTGDKDLMQLVEGSRVTLLDTMKGQRVGPQQVVEKWGVGPEGIVDILALMGDTSDNIPGVAGIGAKGAAQLIKDWGSLEAVFENAEDVKGRSRKPLLAEGALESARLSQELATIALEVEVGVELPELALTFPPSDASKARTLFQDLEFHRLLDELGGEMKALATDRYRLISDLLDLREMIVALRAADTISLSVVAHGSDPHSAELVGLGFCVDPEEAWYVPLDGDGSEDSDLTRDRVLLWLRAILENPTKRFVSHDLQAARAVLARVGVELSILGDDTAIASFLLNSERKTHDLPGLALTWLRHKMAPPASELEGGLQEAAPADILASAAEAANVQWMLRPQLEEALEQGELLSVYRDIDVPLVPVLARMEAVGIRLDVDLLAAYREELVNSIEEARAETWEHAGREFNSSSPKQLGQILFEELGLPVIKRTKTGPSTDASVLEELAEQHPLPKAILRYRSFTKLLSTYVDALPPLVHPDTGRIHTHYSQVVAATGRLSSHDPNLQNIPIRTPEGRRIREAFLPAEGHVLLSADYSQVELRVMAHLCGGGGFSRAFAQDMDVHSATASEVFGVPLGEVTPSMRSTAKAVNFGLAYGQTEFGLSRALRISRAEAKDYIARYKERFPEIDQYMEESVAYASEHHCVRTISGRRRPVADLTSSNYNHRMAARRVAVNTPVQGTAADIIKLAMLRVDTALRSDFPSVNLLLQVHDELVLEVPEGLVDPVRQRVVEEMEAAYPLSVPLKVDTGVGRNWDEAH